MVSPPFIYKICQICDLVIKRNPYGKNITTKIKKETEDMISQKRTRNHPHKTDNNNENFFWNLFLETGRIDAYLLLKEEEAEQNQETKP